MKFVDTMTEWMVEQELAEMEARGEKLPDTRLDTEKTEG